MRFLQVATSALLFVLASGCSIVVKNELEDKPAPDAGFDEFCRGQVDGFDCSTPTQPGRICVDFRCVEKRCGDTYVDTAAIPAESCDDGNEIANDGCENDCTITCVNDLDCDDGNVCDGAEECGINNAGLPACGPNPDVLIPPVGTPCGLSGDGGVGAGMCDAEGVCQF